MMINALNSGARVFMADFEDALSPPWTNVVSGQLNCMDAVRGKGIDHLGEIIKRTNGCTRDYTKTGRRHVPDHGIAFVGKPSLNTWIDDLK